MSYKKVSRLITDGPYLFRTQTGRLGKLLMAIHSHQNINWHYRRIPHLFEVDDSGDKLIVRGPYIP
jgi:hypothetical protein